MHLIALIFYDFSSINGVLEGLQLGLLSPVFVFPCMHGLDWSCNTL